MNRAIFFDRDGVLNEEAPIENHADFDTIEMIYNSAEAVKKANELGFLTIVVTNQSIVARNLATEEQVQYNLTKMVEWFYDRGAKIDAWYYCPHHPEKNHPEANDPRYRRECNCRKPKPGMLLRAAREYDIDLSESFMIGDSVRDFGAGKEAGVTVIGVKTGHAGADGDIKPDYWAEDVKDAVDKISELIK